MNLKIINPYDQQVFHEMAFDGPLDREKKIQRAFQTLRRWRDTPLSERIAVIRQGLDYFDRHREAIAAEITGQMGKPILPVQSVIDDHEALERMNDSRYGLTASVWTRMQERTEWLAARLEAGTVYQNSCDYLDPGLPWSGVKDSGRGTSLSAYGYYHLTRTKSLYFKESG